MPAGTKAKSGGTGGGAGGGSVKEEITPGASPISHPLSKTPLTPLPRLLHIKVMDLISKLT